MKKFLYYICFISASVSASVAYSQDEAALNLRTTNQRWQTNFVTTGKSNETLLNNPTEKCVSVTILIVYHDGNSINKTFRVEAYSQTLIKEAYARMQILNERAC